MAHTTEAIAAALKHHQAGRWREAEQMYQKVVAEDPNHGGAWNLLGILATQRREFELAVQYLETAIRLKPESAQIHYNLGVARQEQGDLEAAVGCYRRAVRLDPSHALAHHNLGAALGQALQLTSTARTAEIGLPPAVWSEARHCFERAIALRPDLAEAHINYGTLLLADGEFERGWAEYEWRSASSHCVQRQFDKPRWEGGQLQHQTILLHAEQGLGDTIQFVRYAALVKERGATVVVECQRALKPLLSSCAGIDQLAARGEELPTFDVHVPLLSLPRLFKTTIATVPAKIPYLFANPELVALWCEKLRGLNGFRIGINWRGGTTRGLFHQRDIPLRQFAPLAELPVDLIKLQKEADPREWAGLIDRPIYCPGDNFDEGHGAFMDTAALVMNLDLVITCDTSLAHLAGALGVPVWIVLPFVASWQWMRDRADSPWYPTARLFRQKAPGDWSAVFQEIQAELHDLLSRHPKSKPAT